MWVRKRIGIILVIVAAACSSALAAEEFALDPALIRRRLVNSVGSLPWNTTSGYGFDGRFILKAGGEEIHYKTRYFRSSNRWAADFSHENRSRNLRYVFSGTGAWIASPEITADVTPILLPYVVRFDFPQLYEELLRILERGNRDRLFAVNAVANQIHISGKLRNDWEATFVLNTVEYFPRKVLVTVVGQPSTAWLLAFPRPDGSCSLVKIPGPSSKFEIWLSDPVDMGAYRFARRLDFAEQGDVVATLFLEENVPGSEDLFRRPPAFPWSRSLQFDSRADLRRPALYLKDSEIPAFRSRIKDSPWSLWIRENRLIAFWAILMPWIGPLFPHVSLRLIAWGVVIGFLGFLFLLMRRRQFHRVFSWKLLAAGVLVSVFVLAAGVASYQLHLPRHRSLIALHSAIRYAVSGHSFYARSADSLLLDFARGAPWRSIEDLGHSCQAYALAYDLIRSDLPRERRVQIENDLFNYARPLFGASFGWISNTGSSSVLSAGLGMVGLAIGYEPFTSAAREVIDRTLGDQLAAGLHQSGPGQGSGAMDAAANLFYGLKHTGHADYFSHPAFRQYVSTTLQMLSPVGTLPLFGSTDLEQSARLSAFFLKIADQLPEDEGRRCVAAHNLYWAYGRYHAEGWIKWILPAFQPAMAFFENPYLLLQCTRMPSPSSLLGSSAVLGNGQAAVLRTGSGPDSVYLAVNTPRHSETSHRDILSFDLYAFRSLLLHGPGFPGENHPRYGHTKQTAAGNSITLNNESQSAAQCSGIESSLLNQPVFDHIRALADKTYDYGQVRRDIVMVRPDKNNPAYFFLLDDVFVSDPATIVQWHLHGRGDLATGIDQVARWTSVSYGPPKLRMKRVSLEAAHPIGIPGNQSQKSGVLYSEASFLYQHSEGAIIEWTGSRRFCTFLFPYRPGETPTRIESLGKSSCRAGDTDWISLGNLESRVTAGPLTHISEYTIVRDRDNSFPAILMISGMECRFGLHSLSSSKPVTASLNGLNGGFRNLRPDTRIEMNSPEIKAGDRFRLDNQSIIAGEAGRLVFTLAETGEHSLHHIS